ncbi:MAG: hypothetical protein ACR2J8_01685, partial [Thermomicrobiales bacterium]
MDHTRFDAALRALGRQTTRRRGLAAAFGVILGGAGMAEARAKNGQPRPATSDPAGAKRVKGPCGDGSEADNA